MVAIKSIIFELFLPSPKKKCNIGNFQVEIDRARDPERTKFLAETQSTFNKMIGIKKDANIVGHSAAVEDEVAVNVFEQEQTNANPVLVPIQPGWRYLNGRWNHSLSEQFASWMVKHQIISKESKEDAVLDFLARVAQLSGLLKKNSRQPNETLAAFEKRRVEVKVKEEKRAKKNTRRTGEVTEESRGNEEEDAAWKRVDEVIDLLGYGSMSSDESEYDDAGLATGNVLVGLMPWNSTEIMSIMKLVDADRRNKAVKGIQRPAVQENCKDGPATELLQPNVLPGPV
ncbi:hypothetical protein FA15DRAFT_659580 [Coprinopsis marcescibilis]|uniref:Uncharacterized protein n=1 Tax=Coprinopsis marcescibilis TaxID=230819 RepID=A0A5C3KIC5_COPMA|nr:hypothetical protein FA15DRAFT_659580 [Coprinopsis marcescibilis]